MTNKIDSRFINPEMTTDSELAVETSARQAADQQLSDRIDAEEAARASADTTLQNNINTETAARIAADNAEASARIAEDLTFLKLDGSRSMTGSLDLNNFDILNINKSIKKILVTTPTFTAATTNGTLNLSNSSSSVHFITGTASGYSVVFPNATTLSVGTNYEIYNRSSSPITLKYSDGSTIGILSSESVSSLILQSNSTAKGLFSPFTVEVAQAAGILNYASSSLTAFSTISTVYTSITDFAVTPAAGKYAIWFNCSATSTTNNSLNYIAIYKAGTILADSERVTQAVASNFTFQMNTLAIADFDGTQELRVFTKVTTGTLTINARTAVATRLGPVG